jgi:hypothetical protein
MMTEVVMAPVFKRFLYSAVPDIGIVVAGEELDGAAHKGKSMVRPDEKRPDVYMRSTFLGDNDFETLSGFTMASPTYTNVSVLTSNDFVVEGLEELFASCIAGGEIDPHGENIGVVPKKDEYGNQMVTDSGKAIYLACKIDHGRSAHNMQSWFSDYDGFIKDLSERLCYGEGIGNFLDKEKLAIALEAKSQISEEEVRTIISKQVYALRDSGANLDILGKGSTPDEIIDSMTKTTMSNIALAKSISTELQQEHRVVIPNTEVSAQSSATERMNKQMQEQSNQTAKMSALCYDLNKKVLPEALGLNGIRFEIQDGVICLDLNGADEKIGVAIKSALLLAKITIEESDGKFIIPNNQENMKAVETLLSGNKQREHITQKISNSIGLGTGISIG